MKKAFLMCGDLFLGIYDIPAFRNQIRLEHSCMVRSNLSDTLTMSEDFSTTANTMSDFKVVRNELVFRVVRQISHDSAEYQFVSEMRNPKHRFLMYINIVELEDGNEAVNLNILTTKLRDNLKTRELLIKYYNS